MTRSVDFLQLLRIRVLDLQPGYAALFFPFAQAHTRGDDIVQGGLVTSVLDSAIAQAALTALYPHGGTASIELKVNFLRPAKGDLQIEGWLIHKGRRTIVGESVAINERRQTVAKCLSAVMVVQGASPFPPHIPLNEGHGTPLPQTPHRTEAPG